MWGNAGDKWGLKGQRTCCCYCDQVDLPILLSVSSAVVLVISEALSEDIRTVNTCYLFELFLVTIECGLFLLIRVFSVFTL